MILNQDQRSHDVIYTSCTYATMSVSVCLWRLCLWSQGAMEPEYLCMLGYMDVFATYWQHLTRIVGWNDAEISGGREEGSSRAILATARPSCYYYYYYCLVNLSSHLPTKSQHSLGFAYNDHVRVSRDYTGVIVHVSRQTGELSTSLLLYSTAFSRTVNSV